MANRIDFFYRVYHDKEEVSNRNTVIQYIRDTVMDSVDISQQFFVIPANTLSFEEISLELDYDAPFTYFYDSERDTENGGIIKLNEGNLEIGLKPDLWIEEPIEKLEAKNETSRDRIVYVFQVQPEGVII